MRIAHFGGFDVENYGDLLFPLVLERRLTDLGLDIVHVSPRGGGPVWADCVTTVAVETLLNDPAHVSAVLVGGGYIIEAAPTRIHAYDRGGLSGVLAYPSLWLGAAYLAAERNIPFCWNAPGVRRPFSPVAAQLATWATSMTDYLSVRDEESRARLATAGVTQEIHVVPDTALEVFRLWSSHEVDAAYAAAFADRGRDVPRRTVAIHLTSRFLVEDIDALATTLDRICRRLDATAILLALGPCHGDTELQRRVDERMTADRLVIDEPRSLRELAACIARSEAYLGTSLHGMITACSFGRRGLLVVPETAETYSKFVGFLKPFQLTRWLCATWEEAEGCLDELLASPQGAWERVLDAATPTLDHHWQRLQSLIAPSSDGSGRRSETIDKRAALERVRELDGGLGRAWPVFTPLIAAEVQRMRDIVARLEDERQEDERQQVAESAIRRFMRRHGLRMRR